MLTFQLFVLALFVVTVASLIAMVFCYDHTGFLNFITFVVGMSFIVSFVMGFTAIDKGQTTVVTTEYDVWKIECPYGTFVSTDDGVQYSPETSEDYSVIYIDNGTLVTISINHGDSDLTVVISGEADLSLTIVETDKQNLLGVNTWLYDETTYTVYLPDPRTMEGD